MPRCGSYKTQSHVATNPSPFIFIANVLKPLAVNSAFMGGGGRSNWTPPPPAGSSPPVISPKPCSGSENGFNLSPSHWEERIMRTLDIWGPPKPTFGNVWALSLPTQRREPHAKAPGHWLPPVLARMGQGIRLVDWPQAPSIVTPQRRSAPLTADAAAAQAAVSPRSRRSPAGISGVSSIQGGPARRPQAPGQVPPSTRQGLQNGAQGPGHPGQGLRNRGQCLQSWEWHLQASGRTALAPSSFPSPNSAPAIFQ